MKKVSIIIVTYNSEKDIFPCVESIKTHADIPLEEIELIIVDNNSREPEPMFQRLRQQWGKDIICIENTHNGGYGQGNNVGIRRSTAPVILIMNPDVRIMDPFFRKPLEAFDRDPKLTMYGMKQMLTPTEPSSYSIICTYMMNGYLRTLLNFVASKFDLYLPKYMFLSGSCFYVRRFSFETVGLFDESVFMYGEEDDIHCRLMKAFGLGFRYDTSIRYLHLIKSRKPDLKYEINLIKATIKQNVKNGKTPEDTVRCFIQKNNLQMWRERLRLCMGKGNKELYNMFRQLDEELKELKEYKI